MNVGGVRSKYCYKFENVAHVCTCIAGRIVQLNFGKLAKQTARHYYALHVLAWLGLG